MQDICLEFKVFDTSSGANRVSPSQVDTVHGPRGDRKGAYGQHFSPCLLKHGIFRLDLFGYGVARKVVY